MSIKIFNPSLNGDVPEVSVRDVYENIHALNKHFRIIDVRRPEELTGELSMIDGAEHVELGPALERFLETENRGQELVFVCRSGGRSARATAQAIEAGFSRAANMIGGMLEWNDLNYPTKNRV